MFAIGDEKWAGLSKLIEEAGEVLQVAGKLMGSRGETKHWSSDDLGRDLFAEMGQLQAAIEFVMELSYTEERSSVFWAEHAKKKQLYAKWHREDPEHGALKQSFVALDEDDCVLTIAEWISDAGRGLSDDDGHGVYAKLFSRFGTVMKTEVRAERERIPSWVTHVVWYNK